MNYREMTILKSPVIIFLYSCLEENFGFMVFGGDGSGGLGLFNRKDKNLFEPKGASLLGVKLLC